MTKQQILSRPFDIDIHSKTFDNYCEVIILDNGTIIYATPSHQEKVIELYCQKYKISKNEFIKKYCDNEHWLNQCVKELNIILVYTNSLFHSGYINKAQKMAIAKLIKYNCINDTILNDM